MNEHTRDYLMFRRMITPMIIQVIFWLLVGLVVLGGLIGLVASIWIMVSEDFGIGLGLVLTHLVWIVLMPILIRIYCELVILFFRMNETLTDIKQTLSANRPNSV